MLRKLLNKLIKIFEPHEEETEQIQHRDKTELTLAEAIEYIQDIFSYGGELSEIQNMLKDARAGDIKNAIKIEKKIEDILAHNNKSVQGLSLKEAAFLIYSKTWGLGVCEKYNRDPEVDEIRVNRPDQVFIVKHGKSQKVPEAFENETEVETTIKRMFMDDTGAFLDKSNPTLESVRKDGSRLTATCYPVTDTWTFVLRKHGTFVPTLDNYIKSGTFDKTCWNVLNLLVKGRASIIISGNVGAGKTTLMRRLIGELDNSLRIISIGKDSELRIKDQYPEKDVIELEEHKSKGADMRALFNTVLRYSPDVLITEEFRSAEETLHAIRACNRGLPGSMASAHFDSALAAVEGAALMLLETGLGLSLEMAKIRIARAFNIVVQMYGDSITGKKKIISITEVFVNAANEVQYRELVRWEPSGENYMGNGKWVLDKSPSKTLITHLLKNIKKEDLEVVGWDPVCIT